MRMYLKKQDPKTLASNYVLQLAGMNQHLELYQTTFLMFFQMLRTIADKEIMYQSPSSIPDYFY